MIQEGLACMNDPTLTLKPSGRVGYGIFYKQSLWYLDMGKWGGVQISSRTKIPCERKESVMILKRGQS